MLLRRCRYVVLSWLLLLLTACHSTGNAFKSAGVDTLIPGVSTYQDVVQALEAFPTNYYYQPDGAFMARWAHVQSLLPDSIYMDRELWLLFDSQQRFIAIEKRHNVQQATQSPPDVAP